MRQIKFRAWEKKMKQIMTVDMLRIIGNDTYHQVLLTKDGHEYLRDISEVELMQFTGLKDKNGKEIFEGDIVKYKELDGFDCEDDYPDGTKANKKIQEVKFNDGEFWPKEHYHYCDDGYYSWRFFDFEIIGNIYENPESLNEL